MRKLFKPASPRAWLVAALVSGSMSLHAQKADLIQFDRIVVSSGERQIGFNEMPFTKVMLSWNVPAKISITHCEVECSFDMVNFQPIGTIKQAVTSDRKQRTYQFEDNSWILSRQSKASYRIKLVDDNGQVSYSEALLVGLRS